MRPVERTAEEADEQACAALAQGAGGCRAPCDPRGPPPGAAGGGGPRWCGCDAHRTPLDDLPEHRGLVSRPVTGLLRRLRLVTLCGCEGSMIYRTIASTHGGRAS